MKISGISTIAVALVMGIGAGSVAMAQGLTVTASGVKTVKLSDRVSKNQFVWVSNAPLENMKGTAEGVSGTLTLDPKNLSTLHGTVGAMVNTMKSGNAMRDAHIQSPQWLDGAKYPSISFTIGSVSGIKVAGNSATGVATGKFTMHGVTKSLSVPFKITYLDESAETRKRAPGDLVMITATFGVALADYNVSGARGTIGSKVGEKIQVTAQLFGSTGL
ncbi:MAG: YceI family protein [Candidatus Kapaibacterium sp.]